MVHSLELVQCGEDLDGVVGWQSKFVLTPILPKDLQEFTQTALVHFML